MVKANSKNNKSMTKARKNKNAQQRGSQLQVPSLMAGVSTIRAPAANGVRYTQGVPDFKSSKGACRIRHREFILDAAFAVSFSGYSASINPGLPNTFPWLSTLAAVFETYSFKSLRFVYEPTCGSSTTGYVAQYIDYDAADDEIPTTKTEVMSMAGSTLSPIWVENAVTFRPTDGSYTKRRYVRMGALADNEDLKTYDAGIVGIYGSSGSGAQGGSWFVEYEVELYTPQFNLAAKAAANSARLVNGGATTLAKPLGAAPVKTAGSGLLVTPIDDGTNSRVVFTTPGQYLLDYILGGTTITAAPTVTANGSAVIGQNPTQAINAAGTVARGDMTVTAKEPGDSITINMTGAAATLTSMSIKAANYLATLF
jgi:hypothetical protein